MNAAFEITHWLSLARIRLIPAVAEDVDSQQRNVNSAFV